LIHSTIKITKTNRTRKRKKVNVPYGSVIAKQMFLLPSRHPGTTLAFISSEPKCKTGGKPIPRPPTRPQRAPPDPQRESSSQTMNSWKASYSSGLIPHGGGREAYFAGQGLPTTPPRIPASAGY
jgi:hypothetical protein